MLKIGFGRDNDTIFIEWPILASPFDHWLDPPVTKTKQTHIVPLLPQLLYLSHATNDSRKIYFNMSKQ